MKPKEKDKELLLEKFPDFEAIIETDATTKLDNIYYSGSVFVSIIDYAFVCAKSNLVYKIPWIEINSFNMKAGIFANKIFLKYGGDRELIFSFTSSDPVYSINVLSKTKGQNIQSPSNNNDKHINEIEMLKNKLKLKEQYIQQLEKEKIELITKTSLTNSNNREADKIIEFTSNETVSSKPLNLNYTKAKKLSPSFVVLDFETTGLKYHENEIIQYGLVEYQDGKVIEEHSQYFKPNKPVGKTVMRITGITNEFLEDKPKLSEEYMKELKELLEGKTIVAHNAPFDLKFLLKNLHKFNVEHKKFRVFDTLTFARRLIDETPNHKLETLKKHFNLDDGLSHNALNDCKATGNLALLLIDRMNSTMDV
ncbi:3'-5' exonuclease [Staphylococcus sp. NAM3COL9]|uniref:3'-5' exonuclease n=1 Tax=Staphylococcus sp. NAM3COL9 TaxID=1667172 RepID=UPI00070B0E96|nr:3'-5' exonuclease [Staphylococcus sp. NAM3COL9]